MTAPQDRFVPPADIVVPDRGPPGDRPPIDMPPVDPNDPEPDNNDLGKAPEGEIGTTYPGVVGEAGDLDYRVYELTAGDLIRITYSDLGKGFNTTTENGVNQGAVEVINASAQTYERFALQEEGQTSITRQLFIRQTGLYAINMGPIGNIALFNADGNAELFRGGPTYTYKLTVTKEKVSPFDIASLPATGLSNELVLNDVHIYKADSVPAGFLGARLNDSTLTYPILAIWDPGKGQEVAVTSFAYNEATASTLAGVTAAGERWVLIDNLFNAGGPPPDYTLDVEAVPAADNDTCETAADVATEGEEVVPGDATRKRFVGWTAGVNDVALSSTPAPSVCIETPEGAMAYTLGGPDLFYAVTVPAGARLGAQLDSNFDAALYLVSNCADIEDSCVAGSDIGALSETLSYENTTAAAQNLILGVDTADDYGGSFNLLVNTNAQCGVSTDCATATALGDYCEAFGCVDPSAGNGTRVEAAANAAGLPIADGTNTDQTCLPGAAATTTFEVPVTALGNVTKLHVYVDITHTYRGDLTITLAHPDGTTVTLKQNVVNDAVPNLNTVFPAQTALPEGQDLATLNGKLAAGQWTLSIVDTCAPDTGTLNKAVLFVESAVTP